jgi:hypothetical protein
LCAALLAFAAPAAAQRCEAPQVLLVMDKSSSMNNRLPEGITKWEAARMALAEVTSGFDDRIDFGLQIFPFPDRCQPGEIVIGVGPGEGEVMLDALGEPPPTGGNYTPMAQSLDVIGSYGPMLDDRRDNHVILITDGWQWCDPYDDSTRFTPVDSVDRLSRLGMTVHVVGFGAGVDSLTLNRAAVAGGTALPGCDPTNSDPSDFNHCYQQADDLDGLRFALDDIARDITDEVCDGRDNDCDMRVDEGFDRDMDGFTTCGTDFDVPGRTDDDLEDCEDRDDRIHPGAEEICDDLDNDCDGDVDPGCGCLDGETRECGRRTGVCETGVEECVDGVFRDCTGGVPPMSQDLCDGEDEDCDNDVDEDADCGDGRRCMDGECIELTPPGDDGEKEPPVEDPPPEEDDNKPRPGAPAASMGGGCCAVHGPERPAAPAWLGGGALGLLALWRRRRRRS